MSAVSGALQMLAVREAIASVALSHQDDCECTTCRAAGGDEDAMVEILGAVARLTEAEAGR